MKYVALFIGVLIITAFLTFNVFNALSSDVPSSKNNSHYFENTTKKPTTGTRENPLSVGKSGYFGGYTYSSVVTVTEVLRGLKAQNFVLASHDWNGEAPVGQEYLLVKVKVKVINTKGEGSASVSNFDFDFVNANGEIIYPEAIYGLEPKLADVYKGGTTEGYIWCTVPVGEKIMISYQDGNLWFSLE